MTSIILWALVAAFVAFIYYVHWVEPNRLQTERIEIKIDDLPPELQGLSMAMFSDTHVRDDGGAVRIAEEAVKRVVKASPEIVFIAGDVAHRSYYLQEAAGVLEPLQARYGVYMVFGNHDRDFTLGLSSGKSAPGKVSIDAWMETMEDIGINLLYNTHHELDINGKSVVIVGVGDPSCGLDDLDAALEGAPEGDLKILLSHSPDIFDYPQAQWADLILCGHTHGGQIQLPGIGSPWAPVWRDRRRASGLMRIAGDTMAYVSRGVGSGTRARFNCPPEIAILTTKAGRAENVREIDPLPTSRWSRRPAGGAKRLEA
ncbi:MAG: metallophosphoesterase [Armatimonadota bacterium]